MMDQYRHKDKMRLDVSIETQIKWPADLMEGVSKSGGFVRGTPPVGDKIVKRIAAVVVRGVKNNIKRSMTEDGGRLQRLNDKTIEKKAKAGNPYPSRPLRAKGVLYRAIHFFKTGPNKGAVSIKRVGKYGTKTRLNAAQIAEVHINGLGVPVRDFWFISTKTNKDISTIIREEFKKMMRRSKPISQGIARGGKAFANLDI